RGPVRASAWAGSMANPSVRGERSKPLANVGGRAHLCPGSGDGMGGGIAAAALLLALGQPPQLRGRADVAALWKVDVTPQLTRRLRSGLWTLPLSVEAGQAIGVESQARAGRSLALGLLMKGHDADFALRAGYRFGLPLDVPEAKVEDSLVLTSGGTLRVSFG